MMRSSDLVAVLTGSTLIAVYLLAALLGGPAVRCGEPPIPANAASAAALPAPAAAAPGPAPWVRAGKPVPAEVLYNEQNPAPAPAAPVKERSWFNKLLFPTVMCPYCGRRVPTTKGSYWFLLVGFVGQMFFSGRFLVQWLAAEKARAPVIPEAFWWLSIFGSLLLLAYAISIMAWPIILGQTPNCFIYGRNLYFEKKNQAERARATPGSETERNE